MNIYLVINILIALCVSVIGFCIGNLLGYNKGVKDSYEIFEDVIGKDIQVETRKLGRYKEGNNNE